MFDDDDENNNLPEVDCRLLKSENPLALGIFPFNI